MNHEQILAAVERWLDADHWTDNTEWAAGHRACQRDLQSLVLKLKRPTLKPVVIPSE